MRRIGALLGLAALLVAVLKMLGYSDILETPGFAGCVAAGVVILVVCRFCGIWPFSG
jgi:hypothetical protein